MELRIGTIRSPATAAYAESADADVLTPAGMRRAIMACIFSMIVGWNWTPATRPCCQIVWTVNRARCGSLANAISKQRGSSTMSPKPRRAPFGLRSVMMQGAVRLALKSAVARSAVRWRGTLRRSINILYAPQHNLGPNCQTTS